MDGDGDVEIPGAGEFDGEEHGDLREPGEVLHAADRLDGQAIRAPLRVHGARRDESRVRGLVEPQTVDEQRDARPAVRGEVARLGRVHVEGLGRQRHGVIAERCLSALAMFTSL